MQGEGVFRCKKRDVFGTPEKLFAWIETKFGTDLRNAYDPCPFNPTENGLSIDWVSPTYCNPPFSKAVAWTRKAIEECKKGVEVFLLLPWYTFAPSTCSKVRLLLTTVMYTRETFGTAIFESPYPDEPPAKIGVSVFHLSPLFQQDIGKRSCPKHILFKDYDLMC